MLRAGGSLREFACLEPELRWADPTSGSDHYRADFVEETVRWLATRGSTLTHDECRAVVNWAQHQDTELARVGQSFQWGRRSAAAALRAVEDYRRALEQAKARPTTWAPSGWAGTLDHSDGTSWRFEELLSSNELHMEGSAMRHCVALYAPACAAGRTAIVSAKRDGIRQLTVEIDQHTGQLRQVRGVANRGATPEELGAVEAWFRSALERKGESPSVA